MFYHCFRIFAGGAEMLSVGFPIIFLRKQINNATKKKEKKNLG